MKSYSYNAFMRKWNLGSNDPYTLILAADQRISPVDFSDHQIWKLAINQAEPPSIQLSTTFGFRAQNLRVFPQFTENQITMINPADFVKPPQIEFFAPSYVSLDFEPFLGISVNMSVFIPDSKTIAGKFRIRNSGGQVRKFIFDLIALLNPDLDGQNIHPIKKEISNILTGKTSELHPVLFITGGAEGTGGPYSALRHSLSLNTGEEREFSWAMTSISSQDNSFQHARKTTARNWAAETQKIKMLSSRSLDIKTGDLGWDASFAFAQNIARSVIIPSSDHLPCPSFVQVLHPDYGYSSVGDGSDHGHLWNGQTTFDVWNLANILLPSEPEIIKGFLRNFLLTQKEDGFIDGKPGTSGQHQNLLAAPLLAQIAFNVFQVDQDIDHLIEIYPSLLKFFFRWFTSDSQTGELHIPVWDNVSQTNFEYNPAFSHWEKSGQGADIRYVVSPDLLTYLYRESIALQKISGVIGKAISNLNNYQKSLNEWLQLSWNQNSGKFRYLDIESLQTQRGKKVISIKRNGLFEIDFSSDVPKRMMLQLNTKGSSISNIEIKVNGIDQNNKDLTLNINSRDFNLILDRGTFTFPKLLSQIKSIKVNSLPKSGLLILRQVNLQQSDHNSILPLFSGTLSKSDAEKMASKQLKPGKPFNKANGIPAVLNPLTSYDNNLGSVWLPQNHLIIKALYDLGFQNEAAEIYTGLMKTISSNLRKEKSFRRFYHAVDQSASGEPNIISGLPSISLFIHLIGLKIYTPSKIGVHGFNPFPWPVEINYRGLQIISHSDQIKVRFPNGKEKLVLDQTPCIIETM